MLSICFWTANQSMVAIGSAGINEMRFVIVVNAC